MQWYITLLPLDGKNSLSFSHLIYDAEDALRRIAISDIAFVSTNAKRRTYLYIVSLLE